MNLEVIVDTLEDRGVGVVGADIFINFLPQDISGVLVRDYFGGTKLNPYYPGYITTRFMLIARAKDYETSMALARQATTALTVIRQETIRGLQFNFMRPMGLPFAYAPSPGQNVEVAVNMECCYVDASLVAM